MKTFQLMLLCFICFTNSYGQSSISRYNSVVVEITKERHSISARVTDKSVLPGVDSAWVRSLERHLNMTMLQKNGARRGQYIVSVRFFLAKDGTISDVTGELDPGYGMCAEVIRAVKKSRGFLSWPPAQKSYPVINRHVVKDSIDKQ